MGGMVIVKKFAESQGISNIVTWGDTREYQMRCPVEKNHVKLMNEAIDDDGHVDCDKETSYI